MVISLASWILPSLGIIYFFWSIILFDSHLIFSVVNIYSVDVRMFGNIFFSGHYLFFLVLICYFFGAHHLIICCEYLNFFWHVYVFFYYFVVQNVFWWPTCVLLLILLIEDHWILRLKYNITHVIPKWLLNVIYNITNSIQIIVNNTNTKCPIH